MPNLSSLVGSEVVVTTTSGPTSGDKFIIMTTLDFQCMDTIARDERHVVFTNNIMGIKMVAFSSSVVGVCDVTLPGETTLSVFTRWGSVLMGC